MCKHSSLVPTFENCSRKKFYNMASEEQRQRRVLHQRQALQSHRRQGQDHQRQPGQTPGVNVIKLFSFITDDEA